MSERKKTFTSIIKTLISFVIGIGILYLLYQSQNKAYMEECALKGIPPEACSLLDKIIEDISTCNYAWVGLALVIFMLSNIARALRWRILLEPLGYDPKFYNSLGAIMVGYLANLGIPRSGEFVRAAVLARNEDYAVEKVMGTIVTDRLADMVCLLVILAITAGVAYNTIYDFFVTHEIISQKLESFQNAHFILINLIVVGISILLFTRWVRRSKHPLAATIYSKIKGFWDGIISIAHLRSPILFVLYSFVIWFSYYLMTYVVFFAYEPTSHLGAQEALVVFVFGTIGMIFPSPGGMGSYHFCISEGLRIYNIDPADGFSFANILFFSIQIFCNILFGVMAIVLLPILNKKRDQTP